MSRTLDRKRMARWTLGGLLFAGAAWASPWDIDMIDGKNFKAYEWEMKPQPSGVIARESASYPRPREAGYYQNGRVDAVNRMWPETDALVNPYADDPKLLATGERFFGVNCAPCHGGDGEGAGTVTQHNPEKGLNRFPMAAPALAGSATRMATVSDGYIYATIRNGGAGSAGATPDRPAGVAAIGAGMPSYGLLLTDYERWAIVAYIRTLENAERKLPEPPAAEGATDGSVAPADAEKPQ